MTRIIGIDPGMAIVGYSVLDIDTDKYTLVTSGSIQTKKEHKDSERLLEIYTDLKFLLKKFRPDIASIEKLFFFKNQKTIIPVAEARGVILLALEEFKLPIYEYTPIEIKQIITGYGRASKNEVANLVKLSLKDCNLPKLDDTIDSVAIALTCLRCNNF